jgi:predicted dehydrogenase
MSYDDLKVIEAYNFLRSVSEGPAHGTGHGATLDDAVRSAEALEAMTVSAEQGKWVNLT